MNDTYRAALIRAVVGGLVLAGAAFFGSLSGDLAQGQAIHAAQLEGSGIAAGVVFFGNLVVRFGAEGLIDTQASLNGGRRATDGSNGAGVAASSSTAPPGQS